jgi:hypothetical protein
MRGDQTMENKIYFNKKGRVFIKTPPHLTDELIF